MQLDESVEKAFKAGVEFCKEFYVNLDDFPLNGDIEEAYTDYQNGNTKSTQNKTILGQGK